MKQYYVYILCSETKTLYTGVTNDLVKRIYQHKEGLEEGFTRKYRTNRLVYYEFTGDVMSAIAREKEIKKWRRAKKVRLIHSLNPKWQDLYAQIV
jgi:putative endonuclease